MTAALLLPQAASKLLGKLLGKLLSKLLSKLQSCVLTGFSEAARPLPRAQTAQQMPAQWRLCRHFCKLSQN